MFYPSRLSGNAGISVSRIVWVTTNCCFMSDKSHKCAVWTERTVVECLTWWYVEQPLGFEGVNYVLCSENVTGRVTVCRMYCTGWQGNTVEPLITDTAGEFKFCPL
jgi:hypothetical protein